MCSILEVTVLKGSNTFSSYDNIFLPLLTWCIEVYLDIIRLFFCIDTVFLLPVLSVLSLCFQPELCVKWNVYGINVYSKT